MGGLAEPPAERERSGGRRAGGAGRLPVLVAACAARRCRAGALPAVRACLRGGGCLDRWRRAGGGLALLGAVHQLAGYRQGALLLKPMRPASWCGGWWTRASPWCWRRGVGWCRTTRPPRMRTTPTPPRRRRRRRRRRQAPAGRRHRPVPARHPALRHPGGTSNDAVPCCTRIKDTPLTQAGPEAMLTHGFNKMQKIQAKRERVEAWLGAHARGRGRRRVHAARGPK